MFENIIALQARVRPNATALVTPAGPRTYGQFDEDIERLRAHFAAHEGLVGPVAIAMGGATDHWAAIFALARLGMASISLALALPLETQLQGLGVRWLISDRAIDLPGVETLVLAPDWRASLGPADPRRGYCAPATGPDAMARLTLSSGSTGQPKPIALSRALIDTRLKNGLLLGRVSGSRLLALIGLDNWAGFYTPLLVWGTAGTVIFPAPESRWLDVLGVLQPDLLILAPMQLAQIVQQLPSTFFPYRQMQVVIAGGAIPPGLTRLARALLTPEIFISYASSECGFASFGHIGLASEHAGAAGFALPWSEIQAVDDDDRPVPPGITGILRIRGEEAVSGYHLRDGAAEFKDGWFYPGDVGALTADGYVTVLGRTTEVMNCGGVKVAPLPIEDALLRCPGVLDAAAVALPRRNGFDQAFAAIVAAPDFDLKLAHNAVAPLGHDISIVRVDAIPRTPGLAKVKREEVRTLILERLSPEQAAKIAGALKPA